MEQATEIAVYLGVSVLIAALIVTLLFQWRIGKDVNNLEDLYKEQPDLKFQKVDKEGFAIHTRNFWAECGQDINKTLRLYVYNNKTQPAGTISKEFLFGIYKQLNWCGSIQSVSLGCGFREDVNMPLLLLPKVVSIICLNNTLLIN